MYDSIIGEEEPKKKMWSSLASPSSGLAKGKKFLEKLQYVQHVDKQKIPASEITEQILQNLLANHKVSQDSQGNCLRMWNYDKGIARTQGRGRQR